MKRPLLLVFALVIATSCKKSNPETGSLPESKKEIFTLIAGDAIDDSLNYWEFSPTKTIKGMMTGTYDNYKYRDTFLLDVNNDNSIDIQFTYYADFEQQDCPESEDSNIVVCCFPNVQFKCQLQGISDIEFVSTEDKFEVLADFIPQRLRTGDTIDSRLHWQPYGNKPVGFAMATYPTEWNTSEYNGFLGFRMIESADTLYGWIRMNTFNASKIEIYDYVIQKPHE